MRTTLSEEDIEPLIEGLTVMGTGGGGSPDFGRAILRNDLARGRELSIVSPDDLDDDAQVVCGGIIGSTEVIDRLGFDGIVKQWETNFELISVTRVMESVLERRIDAMVPFEVGGLNTPVVLTLAARLGINAVDGDALDRSAPQTQMTSFLGHGISLTPMPLVDSDGNVIVVKHAVDPRLPDKLARYLLSHGSGMGANNHYAMSGRDLKRVVIPGAVSRALHLGRNILAARSRGENCVQVVANHLRGRHVFTGEVTRLVPSTREGFYSTTVYLRGSQGSLPRDAELTIQNETMVLMLDGEIVTIFPDLVCMLDPTTGRGIMSTELAQGVAVALVAAACHPRLREAATSEQGRTAFSPATFGYADLEYEPVEQLLSTKGMW